MKTNHILSVFAAVLVLVSCKKEEKSTTDVDQTKMDTTEVAAPAMEMETADLMTPMNEMMAKMQAVEMTGDFDIDFAKMMIEHHQGAIDMSRIEVARGSDEKLKAMAQKIITMQSEDQQKLKDMLKDMEPAAKSGAVQHDLHEAMAGMMEKMKGMQMTSNVDKDFAMMMIPHHEGSVAMSEIELSKGKNAMLKQMAAKTKAADQKDIAELQEWLKANQ